MLNLTKVALAALLITVFLLAACFSGASQTGKLEGRVTIGPIWPVELPGDKPTIPPEVYEARKVMVYDEHGDKLVKKVELGADGYYSVELKPGVYIVDINHVGVDSSGDVPKEVEIKPGETVELNIDVDTGIR